MPRITFPANISVQKLNLVDPASSHMFASKVKPCMCVYIFGLVRPQITQYSFCQFHTNIQLHMDIIGNPETNS